MNFLSAALTVYLIAILIRVLLTWISIDQRNPAFRVLCAVCDPYLNWFRRFRFLRWGQIDFSPLAALLVLNFLSTLTQMIGHFGQITVGLVLSLLITLIWGTVSLFLLLLTGLAFLRWLAIRFRWGGQGFWALLDSMLQPPAYALGRRLRPGSFLAYTSTLAMLAVAGLVVWAAGHFLFGWAADALLRLPV